MPDATDLRPYCGHPALHGDTLVFVAAGDLWTLRLGESIARRLTSIGGSVGRPAISPDGSLVAFAARQDSPTGVFVMPAGGGEARRLVHHAMPSEPACFSPDGQRVLFVSTLASTNPRTHEIFSVSLDGADVRREPFGPATAIALSADNRIVIGRGYQDSARWKRYRGGLVGQLWAGAAEPLELKRISVTRAGESQPGLWGDRVVFVSDASGTGNVWSCRLDGGDRRQHTRHQDFYVRWMQVNAGRAAYAHGGDIWIVDLATDRAERVDIEVAADVGSVRRRYVDASRFLAGAEPSPDGNQVLITARGKVFAFPNWRGPVRSLGDLDGVRFTHATWMPDGKSVALSHDASGEEEIEIRSLDGAVTKTFGAVGEGRLRAIVASPDGRWLAISEQAAGLQLVSVESGERRRLDRADSGAILEMSWSPDSRWLAYARPKGYRSRIFLHDVEGGGTHALTSPEFDDGEPCFDPAGRYLFFLSRRIYNPYADELQHDVGFPATTKPYAVVLAADRPSPFAPLPVSELGLECAPEGDATGADAGAADRTSPDTAARSGGDGAEKSDAVGRERVRVDLAGLSERIVEVPVQEGRYSQILATKDRVFFLRLPLLGMAGTADDDGPNPRLGKLGAFELASREEKPWATDVRAAALSFDGKTLLLVGDAELRSMSAVKPPQAPSAPGGKVGEKSGTIDLARMRVRVEPRAEWRQMFREAWRQQRGHFWTASMTEVDWAESYRRFEPLMRRVRTRDELSDVLWDMHGDLGTSHAYVIGGDEPWRPSYRTGVLGADFEFDRAAGRHRIARIHAGDTWSPGGHSPLAAPGIAVKAGDWLLAVDGREAGPGSHPWALLERAGPAIRLTVAGSADGSNPRDVVVVPLQSEYRCRHREWIKRNQAIVDERTGGRVGYLHVPDMQVAGLVEFHRAFLWQSGREGLIVDVRDNGGGNVSQILLEKLSRRLIGYVKARWAEPETLPHGTIVGPMVALCNERTGSDGDIFCQSWKQLGLGPLVGVRTWGGVIGIDRSRTLVDGGYTTQPEYAFWFKDRGWEIEGNGVEPDIEVEATPMDHAAGRDPQLERGIAEIMKRLDAAGPRNVELPPPPNRAR